MAQLEQAIQVPPPRSTKASLYVPHHRALPSGPRLLGIPGRPRARTGHAALVLESLLVQRQRSRPRACLLGCQDLQGSLCVTLMLSSQACWLVVLLTTLRV